MRALVSAPLVSISRRLAYRTRRAVQFVAFRTIERR